MRTVITGMGAYIPTEIVSNRDFTTHDFYSEDNKRIDTPPDEVTRKFQQITGIEERRYAAPELNASEIGAIAARIAIEDSGVDPETLDQIIVAHNFGNVMKHTNQTDILPALASRIKHELGIKNPNCVAYDLLFGCPGWVQGVIQAEAYFKSGMASKALVIGTETLSRVLDSYDRDSMIFSDGAGASVLEYREGAAGILGYSVQSHCMDEAYYLYMGKSNFPHSDPRVRYIKMLGRKVYEYAMKHVPAAMKDCLDKSGISIDEVKKVFIHQANEKMDEGIIKAFYKLYDRKDIPEFIMPMSIHKLGNSSVATVPTLIDMVQRGELDGHSIQAGDVVIFASVGAGMNINAICYRF
ncbi:MAG: 3-oxoacyl-ACP synthase [Sphingobacteriales bacterium BACL12 MAG-120802-bin5]|jgi:3-oxoacyl-[acyl-carrier-protein] synthase III|nr:MAG: 3-oxoacyl-ACP synthase [Sphingobacteriales bacterium BACL12 MAG-120802-bin5]